MYREYSPCAILSPYIDKYWVTEGSPEPGSYLRILPDGCTDFIFNLEDTANLADGHGMIVGPMDSYFVGPMRAYSELRVCSGNLHMLGVRFTPCGLTVFTRVPMSEFTDQRVCLSGLNLLFHQEFAHVLREQSTLEERVQVIEQYLLSCLRRAGEIDRQVLDATALIHHAGGQLPVQTLMNKVCLCQRHFERRFKHATGFTPKEYSRIVKFRKAVDILRCVVPANLLTVAVDCGYYDSSHMVKEFRKLSGSLPSAFVVLPAGSPISYLDA